MKKLHIYVDTSVIGGCEDEEFSAASLTLWSRFRSGEFMLVISDLTIQEIADAPASVRRHLENIPRPIRSKSASPQRPRNWRTPILLMA